MNALLEFIDFYSFVCKQANRQTGSFCQRTQFAQVLNQPDEHVNRISIGDFVSGSAKLWSLINRKTVAMLLMNGEYQLVVSIMKVASVCRFFYTLLIIYDAFSLHNA